MTPEQKAEIDNMSIEEMQRRWRARLFSPRADPMFDDRERCVYFGAVMVRKSREEK